MTQKVRVLTVDDSPTIRAMVDASLTGAGFEVMQAENGRDALGLMDLFRPDLIVTDLNMDVMGGFTFVKNVRENPKFGDLPIVVMTTEAAEDFKERGRELGATAWVTKPFDPEKVLRIVHKLTDYQLEPAAA